MTGHFTSFLVTHCDADECEDEGGEEDGDAVCVQQAAGSDWLLLLWGQEQRSGVHQQTPGWVRCRGGQNKHILIVRTSSLLKWTETTT